MKKIVVLQRGWVVVGDVAETPEKLTVTNAQIIRYWGTTRGLGELVSGPTAKTILDPAGTVQAHPLSVVLTLDVDQDSWVE